MSWGEQVEEWVETRRLAVGLALGGLILIGAGVAWWRMPAGEEETVEVLSAAATASQSGQAIVDVAGAVVAPGVYEMEAGGRVGEALEKAGGLSGEADGEWVAKYLNQADRVKDGQKIYIPSNNDQETRDNNQTNSASSGQANSKIDINTAGQGELEGLPGVGPVTAQKIMAGRPYSRIEELVEKKVVGQKVWGDIKDLVAVW